MTMELLPTLVKRSQAGELTPQEQRELDEFERIEHLMILLKTGSLPYLTATDARTHNSKIAPIQ